MREKLTAKKHHKGFTLIELLVVMAIIAVLVTLIVAAINIARRASRDTTRRNNVTGVKAALEEYFAQNKMYPGVVPVGSTNYVPISSIGANATEQTRFRNILEDIIRDPNSSGTPIETINQQSQGAFRYCYYRGQVDDQGMLVTTGASDTSKYGLYLLTEGTTRINPGSCTANNVIQEGEDFSNR